MAVTTVEWTRGLSLPMDTHSVRDFVLDFTSWLDSELITNVVLTPTNCAAVEASRTGTTVKVRVSAVTANAILHIRLTTNSGQVEDFSIRFSLITR